MDLTIHDGKASRSGNARKTKQPHNVVLVTGLRFSLSRNLSSSTSGATSKSMKKVEDVLGIESTIEENNSKIKVEGIRANDISC